MSEARPKRRLTVLQNAPAESPHEDRPAWHFIVITALTMLFAWILLAWIFNGLFGERVRSGEGDLFVTLGNLIVFFVSGALASALAGRYGRAATRRVTCTGGALTAILGWSVPFAWTLTNGTWRSAWLSWALLLLAMILVAIASTAVGFTVMRRRGIAPPHG